MAEDSELQFSVSVVESADDITESEWNSVVEHAEEGSLFHRYEWIAAVEKGLGYQPKHLLVRKESNLIAVYPNFEIEFDRVPVKRLVSLNPGFGGPVATTNESKCISMLSERIPDVCSARTIVHMIRAKELEYLGYNNLLKTHGYRPIRDSCRFLLPLEDGYDTVISNMRNGRRRRIRHAHDENYQLVQEELTEENLRRYHDVYANVMDRVNGTTFPLSFLTELRRMESNVLFLTLHIDGEFVGGAIQLLDKEKGYIHGLLMAVPEEYFDNHATELLYDGVIQWGIDNGYDTYDLGSTSSEATNGLFKYKQSFGGEIVPNLSWEKSCSPVWPLVQVGRQLYWSHLKSPPA